MGAGASVPTSEDGMMTMDQVKAYASEAGQEWSDSHEAVSEL